MKEAMRELTDYERGFIEAMIDMDGSISMSRRKRGLVRCQVIFNNNSLELIEKVQRILGTYMKPVIKKGSKNYKISFGSGICRWLLPQLRLTAKEEKRKLVLKFLSLSEGLGRNPNQYDVTYKEEVLVILDSFRSL